jgi:hypothetical protein
VVLTGPLRRLEVVELPADERADLRTDGVEHTLFVTRGNGLATPHRSAAVGIPLGPGTALTLPLGSGAAVIAGAEGLEYVHAVLAVPGAPEGELP